MLPLVFTQHQQPLGIGARSAQPAHHRDRLHRRDLLILKGDHLLAARGPQHVERAVILGHDDLIPAPHQRIARRLCIKALRPRLIHLPAPLQYHQRVDHCGRNAARARQHAQNARVARLKRVVARCGHTAHHIDGIVAPRLHVQLHLRRWRDFQHPLLQRGARLGFGHATQVDLTDIGHEHRARR